MKSVHVHLVSDSTGETVNLVGRACLVQFDHIEAEEHIWSLVRTED
ncbi:MAG: kinase/pyrophosphorylase, partial [Rhodospirillaceae bacterium]|nr:kinase/pyrophosphorylase [Rhodospirillaceae bacterium]